MTRWPQAHWQTSLWRTTRCSKSLLSLYQVRPGCRYTDSPSCKVSRRNFVLNGIKWSGGGIKSELFLLKQCNKKIRPFFCTTDGWLLYIWAKHHKASEVKGESCPRTFYHQSEGERLTANLPFWRSSYCTEDLPFQNSGCHNVPLYVFCHVSGTTMPNFFLCQTIEIWWNGVRGLEMSNIPDWSTWHHFTKDNIRIKTEVPVFRFY